MMIIAISVGNMPNSSPTASGSPKNDGIIGLIHQLVFSEELRDHTDPQYRQDTINKLLPRFMASLIDFGIANYFLI